MARLENKVVIVTGAGGALGSAMARASAREGARLLLADINLPGAQALADELAATAAHAPLACHLDLGDPASVEAMIAMAVERLGGLDALVNNAADTAMVKRDGRVEDMDIEVWDETMKVNLRGSMVACKYAIPALRARGGGAIVNISSGSAIRGSGTISAYGASKAGLIALSQYVAAQHGHEGIRCNALLPGVIMVAGSAQFFGPVREEVLAQHLSPRLGVPADIAEAVLWLIADSGAYVNGQTISVDGGANSHACFYMDLPLNAGVR